MSRRKRIRTSATTWMMLAWLPCATSSCSEESTMPPGLDANFSIATAADLGVPAEGARSVDGALGVDGSIPAFTIKKVFVIAMENQGTDAVYGSKNASYLN